MAKIQGYVATLGFVAGGLLLVWSGDIHFELWRSHGYRHIPTIGPLFLFQSIAALVLGAVEIAVRRVWAAALGLVFAVATIGGFVISVEVGLFGFQDSWMAPSAQQAFAVEVAIAVASVISMALCLIGRRRSAEPALSAQCVR